MIKRTTSLAAAGAILLSLCLAATVAAEVRVGPNYRLNSDASKFRAVDQIGLTTHRTNSQHLVAVNANYLDLRCEASRSLDGGVTWSPAVPLVAPAGTSPRCQFHQSVEFGTGQNVYAIVTANKTNKAIPDTSVVVYKSTDGGLTWGTGLVVMEGGPGTDDSAMPSAGPNHNRPDLAVQPGAGTGGADRIYATARDFVGTGNSGTTPACTTACDAVRIAVSEDGGATYTQKANASPVGVDASDPAPVLLNADGSVNVVWRTAGATGILQTARSTNQGTSWTAPVDVAVVRNTARFAVNDTHLPASVTMTPNSTTATYPRMAADPNTNGRLYMVYTETPTGPTAPTGGFQGSDHFINFDAAVWFQRSNDFGATWSTPKRIDLGTPKPGAETVQTRHPNLSVSPNGRLNVVWHDRRHWFQGPGERNCVHSHIYCDDIRLGDTYLSYSTDGGTTFSPNIRINDRSHNNDVGYDTRPASGYWSWGPQVVSVGNQLLIGWMDSREGNWDTDTEDYYLAKVDFDATGTAPQTHVDAADAIARSVALSKIGYPAGNEGALVGGAKDPANQLPTPLASPPGGPASRNASAVVIVNENDVPGAMAGSVLARANPGPVLLSAAAGLSTAVKDEIARVRPARVFLIGDTTKLGSAIPTEAALAGGLLAPQVIRVAGSNDADTAAQVAALMDYRTTIEKDNTNPALRPAFDAVVIVNPTSPGAAAAVGLAAARRLPILFVGQDSIPAETATALGTTAFDIDKTLVIGDTAAISSTVASGLPGTATRLSGADASAVSQAVVTESKARGLPGNVVYVANAAQPMDAALLGVVAARATGIVMLAPAPLYDTAATQAANFGLTGISRYWLLGPAQVVAPPPPPPPPPPAVVPPAAIPPAAPPPAPPGDTTAPTARLSGALFQKLGLTAGLTVSCTSEACTATVNGTIAVPRVGRIAAKTYKLKQVKAKVAKGAKRKFALRISATLRARIKRAQKARKVVSVKFTVKVSDTAGNARTLRRTVRLKR